MTAYVIIEHDNETINPTSFSALAAAKQLSNDVQPIVIGHQCHPVARQLASLEGVSQVLMCSNPACQYPLAEVFTTVIVNNIALTGHLIAPATAFGKNLLPRVAAEWDVPQLSDVTTIIDKRTFKRPIYAGNAIETVRVLDVASVCLTIRTTAFSFVKSPRKNLAPVRNLPYTICYPRSRFAGVDSRRTTRPALGEADIVIAGGRGLKTRENFARMLKIADKLGAAVGATRAAVDAGLAPNDWQIGQTGQMVAPQLYFALGISGAAQHLAGMKDSRIIVAINKDPDAPIFQVADYGLVADLEQVLLDWEATFSETKMTGEMQR